MGQAWSPAGLGTPSHLHLALWKLGPSEFCREESGRPGGPTHSQQRCHEWLHEAKDCVAPVNFIIAFLLVPYTPGIIQRFFF